MQKHHFSLGLLTEFAPHEHPGLLGLYVESSADHEDKLRTHNESANSESNK